MKKLLLLTVLTVQLKALAFLNQTPVAIAIHPKESYLLVGHQHGYVTLIDAKTLKVNSTKKIGHKIEKMAFSSDGNFLWVKGYAENSKEELYRVNLKDWTTDIKRKAYRVEWNCKSNRIFYTSSYSDAQIMIIDMITSEKVGAIQAKFSDPEAKIEGIFSSSNGDKLILCGKNGYGVNEPGELVIYPSEGFSSKPEKTIKCSKAISNSFGSGLSSKDNNYLFIGWFNAFKMADTVETIIPKWNSCYAVFAASNGEFAYASMGENAAYFDMTSNNFTEVKVKDIGAVHGNITSFCSNDNKNIYFITEDHMVGIMNESGFVIKQAVLNYKVNLVLRDEYKPEKASEIISQLKSAGYKVIIPETYNEQNRVIIAKGVSVEKAIEMEEDIRNKTNYAIQTITEINIE